MKFKQIGPLSQLDVQFHLLWKFFLNQVTCTHKLRDNTLNTFQNKTSTTKIITLI